MRSFFSPSWISILLKVHPVKMITLTGASFSVPKFRRKICKSWDQHLMWGSLDHVGCQEVLTLR